MNKTIDCLIIGHNEMDFVEYQRTVHNMGAHTGAYKDLNLNFVHYNNKPRTASEIFNLFSYDDGAEAARRFEPFTTGETFHAAIAYLGTYLHRRGFSFDYANSFQDQKEELAKKLKTNDYLTIAVTTTLYVSVFPITEVIQFIRKYNTKAKILLGGPFVVSQYRGQDRASLDYLFNTVIGADVYVINSQGEKALVDILSAVKSNSPLAGIDNICYRTSAGNEKNYQWTSITPESNPLSENMVNWDLFAHNAGEFVNVRTAVSCPFSCAFCGFPQHAGKYQTAPVEAVEEELKRLDKIETLKWVQFIDDTFNIPAHRFKELLRMMIRNKTRFKWNSHFRCQFADLETVELMKESGCEGVFLGIESGSDAILKHMNKAASVDKYLAGIKMLNQYDIMCYGSFIIGFPGETDDTVQETTRFIKEAGLDFFRAQVWYADPITPIWEKKEQFQLEGDSFEWSHKTMDSKQAAHHVDKIFTEIQEPTWVPQYNFECDALFHLMHRGFTRQQITGFIQSFNRAVKERMNCREPMEMSMDRIKEIKCALHGHHQFDTTPEETRKIEDQFNADFDF